MSEQVIANGEHQVLNDLSAAIDTLFEGDQGISDGTNQNWWITSTDPYSHDYSVSKKIRPSGAVAYAATYSYPKTADGYIPAREYHWGDGEAVYIESRTHESQILAAAPRPDTVLKQRPLEEGDYVWVQYIVNGVGQMADSTNGQPTR